MSTAVTFIPTFAAITLLLGGLNELSIQLVLVGILGIILHTATTPIDLTSPYPNFDNYHPTQPPFRDYVLVFGLASLALVALFPRIHPLFRSLARSYLALKVRDTVTDLSLHPIPRTPSPSHTFTGQWIANLTTLVAGSPNTTTSQTTGHREVADSSEMIALNLRVSQLEVALEEVKRRLDILSMGEQATILASGITTPIIPKPHPTHTLAPSLDPILPTPTQPLSPSPSPIDPKTVLLATLKPVNETTDARERLRSIVESITEATWQTDQLIRRMRNILSEANTTNDTTLGECRDEENTSSVSSASISTQLLLNKHLPPGPSSTTTSFVPSPYPSPSQSPHPAQLLRTPTIRRVRVASPSPLAVNRIGETAKGSPKTPKLNLTLYSLNISQAPCSTPLRSTEEVEEFVSPSPLSFMRALGVDSVPQDLFTATVSKRAKETDTRVHQANRETSIFTQIPPRDSPPRYKRNFISRIRERSSVSPLHSPPSHAGVESSLDRRNVKGKGKAARTLKGMSNWLAEYRRRRNAPTGSCPLHRNCQG